MDDDRDLDELSVPDPETGELRGSVRCEAIKSNGERCLVRAMPGESECVFHSQSDYGKAWREAGRLVGGRKPILRNLDGMPASIKDAGSILTALDKLYAEACKGDATPANANSILKILRDALRAIELVDIDQRLRMLEEKE